MKNSANEPDYEEAYRIAIQEYIDDGYAQKITDDTKLYHPK